MSGRTEESIIDELQSLSNELRKLDDRADHERLPILIRQGECILEAADPIKKAGGIEKWLGKHGTDLGVGGSSRTTGNNLVTLGRAGLEKCEAATAFVTEHPERLGTTRKTGLDFFVHALKAYENRDNPPRAKRPARAKRPDTVKGLVRKVTWLRSLLYQAITDLEKAVADGWRDVVLNALKIELQNEATFDSTDDASNDVREPERRPARAEHRSEITTVPAPPQDEAAAVPTPKARGGSRRNGDQATTPSAATPAASDILATHILTSRPPPVGSALTFEGGFDV
jgi:hypothetical protein